MNTNFSKNRGFSFTTNILMLAVLAVLVSSIMKNPQFDDVKDKARNFLSFIDSHLAATDTARESDPKINHAAKTKQVKRSCGKVNDWDLMVVDCGSNGQARFESAQFNGEGSLRMR